MHPSHFVHSRRCFKLRLAAMATIVFLPLSGLAAQGAIDTSAAWETVAANPGTDASGNQQLGSQQLGNQPMAKLGSSGEPAGDQFGDRSADIVILGTEMSEMEATPIYLILADPEAYIGRTVRIEGGVLGVCPAKGCWVDLADLDDDQATLRVKVEDDVIVFPADAEGKIIAAEGVVEALDMEREEYVIWLAHLAEERGESFDPESAEIGEGPHRVIQLRGTGAEITP